MVLTLPVTAAPSGVLTAVASAVGHAVAGPVRRGEPLTDVRLLGAGLPTGGAGIVATPVRLADPATASLLHAGDRVDVLAAATDATGPPGPATTVASGPTVLAVPAPGESDGAGALVVLAATLGLADRLAAAVVRSRLSDTVLARDPTWTRGVLRVAV